ncbi:MAG: hypothetical protein JSR77_04965 [Planctomycetes bacterium]|nr:hypothetical protein [Planctomycetota bacterium]
MLPEASQPIVESRPVSIPSPLQLPDPWSGPRLVVFRFAFVYWLVYLFPFPLNQIPGVASLFLWYDKSWEAFVPWFAENVLHLANPITVMPNGSGDTTFNYVQVLAYVIIAVGATFLWSLLHRAHSYPRLNGLLRVYLRYALGGILLGYGFSKVFKSQFPTPGPERLLETYGESSPMGILWAFMGASTPYTIFAGAAEVVGALLLFCRRTATLGALVSAGVMLNVVMLNLCYDVPVKLFSSHLLMMAIWIALPDLGQLLNVLVLHKPTSPRPWKWPAMPRWQKAALGTVQTAFVLYAVGGGVVQGYYGWRTYGDGAPLPNLYGVYEVQTFELNGKELSPLQTDTNRWRRFFVTRWGGVGIQSMTDTVAWFNMQDDSPNSKVSLTSGGNKRNQTSESLTQTFTLSYERPAENTLVLSGEFQGVQIRARLNRRTDQSFLLLSRGFHWINEYPFNR